MKKTSHEGESRLFDSFMCDHQATPIIVLLFIVVLCISNRAHSQTWSYGNQTYGKSVVLAAGQRPSYLVGTLPLNSGAAFEKLKVEVFGGTWDNSTLGLITYYISSRGGLQINQETHGGGIDNRFAIKVYQNNGQYEVTIQVTADWPAFVIRSWAMNGTGLTEVAITDYTPPGGGDVTPPVKLLFTTSADGNIGLGWNGGLPGKLNISANTDQASLRLFGGPAISTTSLSQKWNMPSLNSNGANLSVITANWDAAGGLGVIEGPGIASPVVWLYGYGPSNAFTVARKDDDGGGANITNIDSKLAPLLQVRANGNVGIGTTNPDQKLTVDGTVRCEEVKVELIAGSGPDYVFEPDYNLTPLTEVESYIKANKHLPEVPSAKEMEEEGLNLKEMNLILLKKVEELTLHLIEQSKKIESQQNLIERQEKRWDQFVNERKHSEK